MATFQLILLVAALLCFLLAAVWNPQPPIKLHFGWLGLACLALAQLIGSVHH